MAKMFLTFKVMPESPEVDFKDLRIKIKKVIDDFGGQLLDKDTIEPVAFGLNSLNIMVLIDESKGSEELSVLICGIEDVSSADVIDMRRLVG